MGKNRVSPPDIKPKRNSFFKRARLNQLTSQKPVVTSTETTRNDSERSNNFFIKTIKNSKVGTLTKNNKEEDIKKPFDKKKWRLQKYSNKYKLQQWEESRKRVLLKEYYKQAKNDPSPGVSVQQIYEEEDETEKKRNSSDTNKLENENNLNSEVSADNFDSTENMPQPKKRKSYSNPYAEYQRIKEEKIKRKEELRRKKEERDKALKEYKKEKTRKYRTLNRKTKNGQPIMKYRMQMLLEQIQKSRT